MIDGKAYDRSLPAFFLLIVAFSLLVWLVGSTTRWQPVPGLPLSGLLMAFCPAAAALVLVYRRDGAAGVAALLKRSLDFNRIKAKAWYLPILLLMPAVMVLSYGVMRLLGRPLPGLHVTVFGIAAMFLGFFIGALGEELGWSGYAIEPMQDRWGALRASLLLGLFWAAWHAVPLVRAVRYPDRGGVWHQVLRVSIPGLHRRPLDRRFSTPSEPFLAALPGRRSTMTPELAPSRPHRRHRDVDLGIANADSPRQIQVILDTAVSLDGYMAAPEPAWGPGAAEKADPSRGASSALP
jgi:membrane protease YdiL (CAAX protease family)